MEEASARSFKYKAFLSYRSADREIAVRLHAALEGYRPPRTAGAPRPPLLGRIFRDRDEARTAEDIETIIAQELSNSEQLIVLCTPKSREAGSWVGREIELFRKLRPGAPVHCIIGYGEPPDCFPDQVLIREPDGRVRQPLAADLRKQGDGWRKGVTRLAAGLLGVAFDSLWQREQRRRRQIQASIGAAACLIVISVSVFAVAQATFFDSIRLATVAEANLRAGDPISALPFAIGAQPPRSALMAARGDRVASTLSELARTPIVADLGKVAAYEMSPDGAAIVAFDDTGKAKLVRPFAPGAPVTDLADAPARPFRTTRFSPDSATALIWSGSDFSAGPVTRVDLATGQTKSLLTAEWVFPAPHRPFIMARDKAGRCIRLNIASGDPIDLGACLSATASPDGALMATFTRDGAANIFAADGQLRRRFSLGLRQTAVRDFREGPSRLAFSIQNFDLGPRGEVLALVDRTDTFRLFDTQTGQELFALPIQAPFAGGYMIPSSRAAVLLTDMRGAHHIVELSKRASSLETGPASGSGFDASMNFLNLSGAGSGARLFDLRQGVREMPAYPGFYQIASTGDAIVSAEGELGLFLKSATGANDRVPIGKDIELRFSEYGTRLVTVDAEMHARIYANAPGFPMREVGVVGRRESFTISASGAALGVRNIDGSVLIYDLRHNAVPVSAANACSASGDAIRPFPALIRAPDPASLRRMSAQDRALVQALRGRPWHPCDWRGLGTSEGWSQALRAGLVRLGWQPDYACQDRRAQGGAATPAAIAVARSRCSRVR